MQRGNKLSRKQSIAQLFVLAGSFRRRRQRNNVN
jgi:hypothetical protein